MFTVNCAARGCDEQFVVEHEVSILAGPKAQVEALLDHQVTHDASEFPEVCGVTIAWTL